MPDRIPLIHEILPVGKLQCNCHIVGDPHTHDAIVIDPGDDADQILAIIARHHLKVSAIVITHTHIDHIVGLHRVQEVTGAPVYMHADDLELYKILDLQASWLGWTPPKTVNVDHLLHDGEAIHWGSCEAQVLHTPGHTKGSICLYMPSDMPPRRPSEMTEARAAAIAAKSTERQPQPRPGVLFSGDTLFAGSIGRTDLWGGSFEEIMRSLKGPILDLPDDTIVYPGHGEATTIVAERESNPFLVGN
jgi:hydroxyacylglutathione hydrolase